MFRKIIPTCLLMAALLPAIALADDLTKIIQKDLIALGYDPGNIQGEKTTDTIVAISKFQAENSLDVTGEPTPQLAGIIKAKLKERSGGGSAMAAGVAQPMDPAALQAAQQACLQEKVAAAQQSKKKKKGFGSLMKAVTNTAVRFGGNDFMREIAQTSNDIYNVDATARDWDRAAKDLGITTDDIEACQNP